MSSVLLCALAALLAQPTAPHSSPGRGAGWPSGYIWRSHESLILRLPEQHFETELRVLLGMEPNLPGWRREKRPDQLDVELDSASEALAGADISDAQRAETLEALKTIRERLPHASYASPYRPERYGEIEVQATDSPQPTSDTVPDFDFEPYESAMALLPADFMLYLKGAAAYRQGKYTQAIAHWEALLALPAAERQYKSAWAAYMTGKAWLHVEPEQAIPHFEHVRTLVEEGFADPLGFQNASLGWQAQAELVTGHYPEAIRSYIEQYRTGSGLEGRSAFNSLHYACSAVFNDGPPASEVLHDALLRPIITAWLLSYRGPERAFHTWAVLLETQLPKEASRLPGLMARLYYLAGEYANARFWVGNGSRDDFYCRWIGAKLKFEQHYPPIDAIQQLDEQFQGMLEDGDPYALRYPEIAQALSNELGVLRYNVGQYTGAMTAFLQGDNHDDAAYIAEHVLTSTELAYFLEGLSEADGQRIIELRWNEQATVRKFLSRIAARKFAREGRFDEAFEFIPYASYLDFSHSLRAGRDSGVPKDRRAQHLFVAARIAREHGMDLFGTWYGPDWDRYDGRRVPTGRDRIEAGDARPVEAHRILSNRPFPNRRFHYKWTAAELMWESAQLLPNNSTLLAQALWYGGTYIAIDDPQGADKFYKALVRRCGKLPIGQDADKRRWFPPKPNDWPYPADEVWN